MARTARFLQDKQCYHVIVTGPKEYPVFRRITDYAYYLRLLRRYKGRFAIKIFGFCLLAERAHMILQPQEARMLSLFMKCVSQSYTAYFNSKYQREGKLWQGRFRSMGIARDHDLFECIKYVEQLPVQLGLVHSPVEYPWSSCSLRILGYGASLLDARVEDRKNISFQQEAVAACYADTLNQNK